MEENVKMIILTEKKYSKTILERYILKLQKDIENLINNLINLRKILEYERDKTLKKEYNELIFNLDLYPLTFILTQITRGGKT